MHHRRRRAPQVPAQSQQCRAMGVKHGVGATRALHPGWQHPVGYPCSQLDMFALSGGTTNSAQKQLMNLEAEGRRRHPCLPALSPACACFLRTASTARRQPGRGPAIRSFGPHMQQCTRCPSALRRAQLRMQPPAGSCSDLHPPVGVQSVRWALAAGDCTGSSRVLGNWNLTPRV